MPIGGLASGSIGSDEKRPGDAGIGTQRRTADIAVERVTGAQWRQIPLKASIGSVTDVRQQRAAGRCE